MKRIVLNIPHSVPCLDFSSWTNPENIKREHDKWTDWFTNIIFAPNNAVINGSIATSEANANRVIMVCAKLSRYDLDLERLIGDEMEEMGQGIIYTRSKNGKSTREIPIDEKVRRTLLYVEHHGKLSALLKPDGSLLLDCHSCPSNFSEAGNAAGAPVDICLGFNNDATRPSDEIIQLAKETFETHGYNVGINSPYSNSIVANLHRPSLMIEVNKRIYLDESVNKLTSAATELNQTLNEFYAKVLA